jgi:hypothetical protein
MREEEMAERVKLFRGNSVSVEEEVNKWLAELPPHHSIKRTETAAATRNEAVVVIVSIWYENTPA